MTFPFLKQVPKFEPRKRIGEANLPQVEKDILDAIDVLQQKSDFACETSVWSWNVLLVLLIFNLVIDGNAIIKIIQSYLAPHYSAASSVISEIPAKPDMKAN